MLRLASGLFLTLGHPVVHNPMTETDPFDKLGIPVRATLGRV